MSVIEYLKPGCRIEVTVWSDDEADQDGKTFGSLIKDIQGNRVLIDPGGSKDPYLPDGTIVGVLLLSENAQLTFYPIVDSYTATGLVGYWLRCFDGMDYQIHYRREFSRVPLIAPVTGQFIADKLEWEAFEGRTVNVSGGGLRFMTNTQIPIGASVQLRLTFPNTMTGPLTLASKVVFSQKNQSSTAISADYVVAVEFKDLSEANRSVIIAHCFRHEVQLRKSAERRPED
jgi:c-di-GMP-binding flagellar brake protein YcgR